MNLLLTYFEILFISGDTNEAQILVAGLRYLDRPAVLESILNDLFHVFRFVLVFSSNILSFILCDI